MIEKTEDTPIWNNLKENSIAIERLLFILVCSKVCIAVSPLLWGDNDAFCGVPADKWSWLSSEYDVSMVSNSDDPETKAHIQKYGVDIDEYNKVLEKLETQWYVDSSDTGNLFTLEKNSTHAEFATGEPKNFTPGGDAIRILRSRDLYDILLSYYSSLSSTYGKSLFETSAELWLSQTPTNVMDMPGFRGSQPNCLRGVLYISLNLYLLKMKNLKIKLLGGVEI